MRIIIIGAGEVGFNIAARLVTEGHDVLIVEQQEAILDRISEALDIQAIRGHGARPSVLQEAGIEDAEMVIAVTDSDEVNMVACLNAAIFGRSDVIKIARVRDPAYLDERFFNDERVTIDRAINPERVTADKIVGLLKYPAITEIAEFSKGQVQLVRLPITGTSPLAGLRFVDLAERFPKTQLLIAALHRDHQLIIPTGSDVILPGDEAYIVTQPNQCQVMLERVGIKGQSTSRVMIAGGSRIARFIAADLEAVGVQVKIVEPNARRAQILAEELPHTVVIHGEPTDAELLKEENIHEMHAFIAVGQDEELNMMSALLARRLGAPRVMATTNRGAYLPILSAIGIDVGISPRMVAVNSILHFVRRGRVVAASMLGEEADAEAMEFEAVAGSDAVGVPLHALKMPKDSLIAAIQRGDEVILPTGQTRIEADDHVLVVALEPAVAAVERLLQRRVDRE
ncbi:MAG: Trk system potassium transporter TrkA [Bradymonadia bacterium]